MDEKAPEAAASEAPETKTNSKSKTKLKTSFFRRRRNLVILAICAFFLLALAILTPVLKLVYFRNQAETATAKLREDASRYAVVKANFPDPCLIKVDSGYYAFATRPLANISIHIQAASATQSISQWTLHDGYDALPNLPPWVKQHGDTGVWAPQVAQRDDGTFVMVYSALHKDHPQKHCLGMATSSTVLGPYDPGNSTEPLLCHLSLGGIIDPTFLDDPASKNIYLVYKNDGNAIGSGGACGNSKWPNTPTTFEHNVLTRPGWTTLASPNDTDVPLTNQTASINTVNNTSIFMHNDKSDGPNIESPQAWYQEYPVIGNASAKPRRAYHLLYDAGCFADKSYRIEHLVCWLDGTNTSFIDCPWQSLKNTSTELLLQTGSYPQPEGRPAAVLLAPGGPGVSQDGKYMAFHADIEPDWFDQGPPQVMHGKNRTQIEKAPVAYTRQRALFIAELEAGDGSSTGGAQGLQIRSLVMPGSGSL